MKSAAYTEQPAETESGTAVPYTASTTATLIAQRIAAYKTENIPTAEDAWEAIKDKVYAAVYTSEYLAKLDASGYDRYSAAAAEQVRQLQIQGKIYKDNYTAESAQAKKLELIDAYTKAHTSSAPKNPTPGYDESWKAVKEAAEQARKLTSTPSTLTRPSNTNSSCSGIRMPRKS